MNKILVKCLLVAVVLLGGAVWLQYRYTVRLKSERDRYLSNTTALLSEVKRMQVDSATMALDAKTLQLTLDEYKRFRAEDAATIKRLGIKVKNLEAAARHDMEVTGPIDAIVRDTKSASCWPRPVPCRLRMPAPSLLRWCAPVPQPGQTSSFWKQ